MRGDCRYGGRAAAEARTCAVRLRMAIAKVGQPHQAPGMAWRQVATRETGHPLLTDRPIAVSAEGMPRPPPLVDRGAWRLLSYLDVRCSRSPAAIKAKRLRVKKPNYRQRSGRRTVVHDR